METSRRMKFGKLVINPARNPGVLDTATWDRDAAWSSVHSVDDDAWFALRNAAGNGTPMPAVDGVLTIHEPSCTWRDDTFYCLTGLEDGQQVFLEIGENPGQSPLGEAIGVKMVHGESPESTIGLAMYPTDAATLDQFFRFVAPEKGPQALGPVPRLGVGTRMTTAVWPAIWQAMTEGGYATNAIQNSVRELNFLDTLLAGDPAESNIAFGFGAIETGYTGSSFEGLWVSGVLDALQHGPGSGRNETQSWSAFHYGADADHIQVKRGPGGLARAKRMLDATRYYSFYTLDVSDVLDYAAMSAGAAEATALLEARIPDPAKRRMRLSFHQQPRLVGAFDYRPDSVAIGRLVGKYWVALQAVKQLYEYISSLKDGMPFDLELSIDEHPNEIANRGLPDFRDGAGVRVARGRPPWYSVDAYRTEFWCGKRHRLPGG